MSEKQEDGCYHCYHMDEERSDCKKLVKNWLIKCCKCGRVKP